VKTGNPPLIIFIVGGTLSGKSTLAQFMKNYIEDGEGSPKVRLLSTE